MEKIEKLTSLNLRLNKHFNGSGHASNIFKSMAQSAGSHGIANLPSRRNLSNEIHP
jgi:hypothetical protein